jgi:hypothetical protein
MVEMVEVRKTEKQWIGYAWFTGHEIYNKNQKNGQMISVSILYVKAVFAKIVVFIIG